MLRLLYEESCTLRSIGEAYGITSQRVRQIVARSIRKLRHPSRLTYIWLGLDTTNRQRKEIKRTSVFPIVALGLSTRTINALVSNGLDTIAKVCDAIANNPQIFRDLRSFGYGSALELVKALGKHGVEFNCQPEYAALLLREGNPVPINR
jgi:DNA-binding CsgD family transcriptional regulator